VGFVDRDYRGVEIDQVRVWKSGQRRGLKAKIRRRGTIKPTIGHRKQTLTSLRNAGFMIGVCSNLVAAYAIPIKTLLPF
jgi:hypothetical protein